MNWDKLSSGFSRARAVLVARWKSLTERFRRPQSGQALVMLGLMMMTLIGFAALATDTGLIWMNRRSLQNAADAAALAGVQALPDDAGSAEIVGCDYASVKNAVDSMFGKIGTCGGLTDVEIKTTYFPNDTITVTAYKQINPIFGIAVGFGSIEIGASATAIIGSVATACPFPLFQTPGNLSDVMDENGEILDPPVLTKLKAGPSGEFLALEVNGSASKAAWKDVVSSPAGCDGNDKQVGGSLLDVNPGTFEGPLKTAMEAREALWTAQGTCTSNNPIDYLQSDGTFWNGVQLTPTSCYRMLKIPLIDADLSTISPSDQFPPSGFAIFYLAAYCTQPSCPATVDFSHAMAKGELWGYYLHMDSAGGTDYVGYDGFGTKVAVLVD